MNKSLIILMVIIAATAFSGCQATKWSRESMRNLNPLKQLTDDKKSPNKKTDFEEPAADGGDVVGRRI